MAEGYRAHLESVIFEPWADELVHFAGVAPGPLVLDVAAGTGAVTRAAARATGPEGRVVASDVSEDMLAQVVRGDEPSVVETVVSSATELDLAAASSTSCCASRACSSSPTGPPPWARCDGSCVPAGGSPPRCGWPATPLHPFELYGEVIQAAGFEVALPGGFDMSRLVMSPDELGALLAGGGFERHRARDPCAGVPLGQCGGGRPGRGGDAVPGVLATLPPDRLEAVLADLEQAVAPATGPDGGFTMSSVLARAVA